uniref:Uncharacterized protein n=1 Tax=Chromera velia CCMP2878 TaxID=1169474 RepID=A0A0G4HJQ0_9ALVE|eukprot:Cvel_7151.t1-p1 / transcript=Cvel_7151.t1 / gene=Cvel_7151 / organism=Chromera_velia_CCMP2878 / gene_product=hypothetical protein / transcript_product=hypothetical protein / location=Cvel_scaffold368:6702-14088(+) / protein_length=2206 / sequence_SO=supercontig / SO=protein_coding / is_pseudo=false
MASSATADGKTLPAAVAMETGGGSQRWADLVEDQPEDDMPSSGGASQKGGGMVLSSTAPRGKERDRDRKRSTEGDGSGRSSWKGKETGGPVNIKGGGAGLASSGSAASTAFSGRDSRDQGREDVSSALSEVLGRPVAASGRRAGARDRDRERGHSDGPHSNSLLKGGGGGPSMAGGSVHHHHHHGYEPHQMTGGGGGGGKSGRGGGGGFGGGQRGARGDPQGMGGGGGGPQAQPQQQQQHPYDHRGGGERHGQAWPPRRGPNESWRGGYEEGAAGEFGRGPHHNRGPNAPGPVFPPRGGDRGGEGEDEMGGGGRGGSRFFQQGGERPLAGGGYGGEDFDDRHSHGGTPGGRHGPHHPMRASVDSDRERERSAGPGGRMPPAGAQPGPGGMMQGGRGGRGGGQGGSSLRGSREFVGDGSSPFEREDETGASREWRGEGFPPPGPPPSGPLGMGRGRPGGVWHEHELVDAAAGRGGRGGGGPAGGRGGPRNSPSGPPGPGGSGGWNVHQQQGAMRGGRAAKGGGAQAHPVGLPPDERVGSGPQHQQGRERGDRGGASERERNRKRPDEDDNWRRADTSEGGSPSSASGGGSGSRGGRGGGRGQQNEAGGGPGKRKPAPPANDPRGQARNRDGGGGGGKGGKPWESMQRERDAAREREREKAVRAERERQKEDMEEMRGGGELRGNGEDPIDQTGSPRSSVVTQLFVQSQQKQPNQPTTQQQSQSNILIPAESRTEPAVSVAHLTIADGNTPHFTAHPHPQSPARSAPLSEPHKSPLMEHTAGPAISTPDQPMSQEAMLLAALTSGAGGPGSLPGHILSSGGFIPPNLVTPEFLQILQQQSLPASVPQQQPQQPQPQQQPQSHVPPAGTLHSQPQPQPQQSIGQPPLPSGLPLPHSLLQGQPNPSAALSQAIGTLSALSPEDQQALIDTLLHQGDPSSLPSILGGLSSSGMMTGMGQQPPSLGMAASKSPLEAAADSLSFSQHPQSEHPHRPLPTFPETASSSAVASASVSPHARVPPQDLSKITVLRVPSPSPNLRKNEKEQGGSSRLSQKQSEEGPTGQNPERTGSGDSVGGGAGGGQQQPPTQERPRKIKNVAAKPTTSAARGAGQQNAPSPAASSPMPSDTPPQQKSAPYILAAAGGREGAQGKVGGESQPSILSRPLSGRGGRDSRLPESRSSRPFTGNSGALTSHQESTSGPGDPPSHSPLQASASSTTPAGSNPGVDSVRLFEAACGLPMFDQQNANSLSAVRPPPVEFLSPRMRPETAGHPPPLSAGLSPHPAAYPHLHPSVPNAAGPGAPSSFPSAASEQGQGHPSSGPPQRVTMFSAGDLNNRLNNSAKPESPPPPLPAPRRFFNQANPSSAPGPSPAAFPSPTPTPAPTMTPLQRSQPQQQGPTQNSIVVYKVGGKIQHTQMPVGDSGPPSPNPPSQPRSQGPSPFSVSPAAGGGMRGSGPGPRIQPRPGGPGGSSGPRSERDKKRERGHPPGGPSPFGFSAANPAASSSSAASGGGEESMQVPSSQQPTVLPVVGGTEEDRERSFGQGYDSVEPSSSSAALQGGIEKDSLSGKGGKKNDPPWRRLGPNQPNPGGRGGGSLPSPSEKVQGPPPQVLRPAVRGGKHGPGGAMHPHQQPPPFDPSGPSGENRSSRFSHENRSSPTASAPFVSAGAEAHQGPQLHPPPVSSAQQGRSGGVPSEGVTGEGSSVGGVTVVSLGGAQSRRDGGPDLGRDLQRRLASASAQASQQQLMHGSSRTTAPHAHGHPSSSGGGESAAVEGVRQQDRTFAEMEGDWAEMDDGGVEGARGGAVGGRISGEGGATGGGGATWKRAPRLLPESGSATASGPGKRNDREKGAPTHLHQAPPSNPASASFASPSSRPAHASSPPPSVLQQQQQQPKETDKEKDGLSKPHWRVAQHGHDGPPGSSSASASPAMAAAAAPSTPPSAPLMGTPPTAVPLTTTHWVRKGEGVGADAQGKKQRKGKGAEMRGEKDKDAAAKGRGVLFNRTVANIRRESPAGVARGGLEKVSVEGGQYHQVGGALNEGSHMMDAEFPGVSHSHASSSTSASGSSSSFCTSSADHQMMNMNGVPTTAERPSSVEIDRMITSGFVRRGGDRPSGSRSTSSQHVPLVLPHGQSAPSNIPQPPPPPQTTHDADKVSSAGGGGSTGEGGGRPPMHDASGGSRGGRVSPRVSSSSSTGAETANGTTPPSPAQVASAR